VAAEKGEGRGGKKRRKKREKETGKIKAGTGVLFHLWGLLFRFESCGKPLNQLRLEKKRREKGGGTKKGKRRANNCARIEWRSGR